jgi:hypothetical protein
VKLSWVGLGRLDEVDDTGDEGHGGDEAHAGATDDVELADHAEDEDHVGPADQAGGFNGVQVPVETDDVGHILVGYSPSLDGLDCDRGVPDADNVGLVDSPQLGVACEGV